MYQAPMMDQQTMNGGQQDQMQQQMMMQQQQADPIAEAKAMLGLDKIEEAMLAQTQAMEAQRIQSIQSEMKAKYPNVSEDAVKKEIDRISESDPALADAMQKSANGLETIYKAIISSSKPTETPDDVLDSAGNPSQTSLDQKVKSGKATQIELGDYILGLNK